MNPEIVFKSQIDIKNIMPRAAEIIPWFLFLYFWVFDFLGNCQSVPDFSTKKNKKTRNKRDSIEELRIQVSKIYVTYCNVVYIRFLLRKRLIYEKRHFIFNETT